MRVLVLRGQTKDARNKMRTKEIIKKVHNHEEQGFARKKDLGDTEE